MTTTINPFSRFRASMKPGQVVYVSFPPDPGMPWTAFVGMVTLVDLQGPELWSNGGDDKGEAHWLVTMPDGGEGFFPISAFYPIVP